MNENNEAAKQIISFLKERESNERKGNPITNIMETISARIEWDVAGLIGVIVTLVLMIMIISKSSEGIPEEIFAGWLTIIGYYFGKSTRQ